MHAGTGSPGAGIRQGWGGGRSHGSKQSGRKVPRWYPVAAGEHSAMVGGAGVESPGCMVGAGAVGRLATIKPTHPTTRSTPTAAAGARMI